MGANAIRVRVSDHDVHGALTVGKGNHLADLISE